MKTRSLNRLNLVYKKLNFIYLIRLKNNPSKNHSLNAIMSFACIFNNLEHLAQILK